MCSLTDLLLKTNENNTEESMENIDYQKIIPLLKCDSLTLKNCSDSVVDLKDNKEEKSLNINSDKKNILNQNYNKKNKISPSRKKNNNGQNLQKKKILNNQEESNNKNNKCSSNNPFINKKLLNENNSNKEFNSIISIYENINSNNNSNGNLYNFFLNINLKIIEVYF